MASRSPESHSNRVFHSVEKRGSSSPSGASAAATRRRTPEPEVTSPISIRTRYGSTPARRMTSPSLNRAVITFAPLTKVPFEEPRSCRTSWSTVRSRRTWTLETAPLSATMLQAGLRPTVTSPIPISYGSASGESATREALTIPCCRTSPRSTARITKITSAVLPSVITPAGNAVSIRPAKARTTMASTSRTLLGMGVPSK